MRPALKYLVLLSALLALPSRATAEQAAPRPESVQLRSFGRVPLVWPQGRARSVALLLSGGEESTTVAKTLADAGALVLKVDTARYLEHLSRAGKCAYPAGDLELLSQFTQKEVGLPEYLHPTLVGTGPGAALAYAALAQAPESTFRGAVGLGFHPELTMAVPLCRGIGLRRSRSAKGDTEVLLPVQALTAPWLPLPGGAASPEAQRSQLQQAYAQASKPPAPVAPPATAPAAVAAAPVPDGGASGPAVPRPEPVGDLPLIEVPAATPSADSFVIMVSGDGGWAGIDKHLASALNTQGLSVVGWDSLRYFWKRRTPEETARDVGRAMAHYLTAWSARRVVLVGYSRGADVLPAIVARLPPTLRAQVRLVALVAPGQNAEFEFHVTDLFEGGSSGSPVLPEIRSLGGLPVLCLYGDEEIKESVCPLLSDVPGARVVMLQGGHHFGGDYTRVARAIIDALPGD